MFEKASRQKIRFETAKGLLTAEDLWDLNLTSSKGVSLDQIAIGLNRQLKSASEESFVVRAPRADDELQLKFDMVKHVIAVRLGENETARTKAETKAKKERLLALIAEKQDEQLKGTSLEELQKMVSEL